MNKLSSFVGNTPLIKVAERIYAKNEQYNPSGSVKDRVIIHIINDAERKNLIKKGDTIVEVSSGNAGVSLAMLGAERGYDIKIIAPENIINEKKELIKKYGAELVEVPYDNYELGRKIRDSLVEKNGWFTPNQHFNNLNIESQKTIGKELIEQVNFLSKNIDAIIIGAGTGGTIMGINEILKKRFTKMKTIAVIPKEEKNKEKRTKYGLNGIGHSEQFLLDTKNVDDYIKVGYSEAEKEVEYLAQNNGIICGVISGANILASKEWVKKHDGKGVVITIISD